MKILILFAAKLFPVKGMYQVRVYNQIKYLARQHQIDFANIVNSRDSIELTRNNLGTMVHKYFPLKAWAGQETKFYRGILKLIRLSKYHLSNRTKEELFMNTANLNRQISNIIDKNHYDAVIIHYWYWGYLFRTLGESVLKIIDTHYVVEENLELFKQGYYNSTGRRRLKKELLYSLDKQYEYFRNSNLIVVNSQKQADIILSKLKKTRVVVAENGQDLQEYLNYHCSVDEHSVLFYGALSSQFNRLALQRILKSIYPGILSKDPLAKLMIVGSNPPQELINQYNFPNMVVTDYVEDIKPFIAKCAVMLLPLETGSGFRGRAIEVLALGVPIVGTQNGLQSIGLEHGSQGFIAQSDQEIVSYALKLIQDTHLRLEMAINARDFVAKRFSLEATFSKLENAMNQTIQKIRND